MARRRKIQRKVVRGRKVAAPPALPDALASLKHCLQELHTRRAALDKQIQVLENAVQMMGCTCAAAPAAAPAPKGKRGRPRAARGAGFRTGSLKEHITAVLEGNGDMAVKDIAAAVVSSGYKSRNKTLAKSVGIALTEMPNVAKVGRGRFKLA